MGFIGDHWNLLCIDNDKSDTWKQTIKMTLSRYRDVFEHGFAELNMRGYWRVKTVKNPYSVSPYTMLGKKSEYRICSFSLTDSRAIFDNRRKALNSVPSAQIIETDYHFIPSWQLKMANSLPKMDNMEGVEMADIDLDSFHHQSVHPLKKKNDIKLENEEPTGIQLIPQHILLNIPSMLSKKVEATEGAKTETVTPEKTVTESLENTVSPEKKIMVISEKGKIDYLLV
jgi:hypothetical protein